ncbi:MULTISPECIES: ATP-dependent DNA helicase DinG [unclassified Sporosarcina]|uniref:ATP-dependent DNA helicase DinG n=1 Tax=unclassified Sporosarcina TaxID=2647733 RepID=UPI00203B1440|nr:MULTISPECIES: ATP-dependent DNA helicase DinG [unclassified Sporosarcina]GKV67172.1 ATP-dependent helicase DinG [Sporosarcina sp. NCCP-2331]GLB57488.1 ATP-dependent helicase DinG [Sporosarcina sp. NCCP-2378]
MSTSKYAVVDLETTGHSPSKGDRIIQIAIVFIENNQITDTYMRYVHPGRAIPPFIHHLTSIGDQDVADAPPFEEIALEVADLLAGCVFVAHNTDFDVSFLQKELVRCGVSKWHGQKIDTVELAKILYPTLPSYRLQDIAEALQISLQQAHRADDDAEATARFLLQAIAKINTLPKETLNRLHERSFALKSDLSTLFYDGRRAAQGRETTRDFALFRGIPYLRMKETVEYTAASMDFPSTDEEKEQLLQMISPRFHVRRGQAELMDLTWRAFAEKKQVAVEIPTGVGKTIGYLIPAVLQASITRKPVVISTYTNHLVDKLAEEVEQLEKALQLPIPTTVIKGMANYISLGKFEELLRFTDEVYDDSMTIMQLLVWLTETKTGDVDEVNVSGGGQLFIDRIRRRSAYLKEDERTADFYSRIVARSKQSMIVVTNHSMLMNDKERNDPLFQSIGGLIADEAHQLYQAAIRTHEQVFSYTNWKYVMSQLNSFSNGQLLFDIQEILLRFHFNHKYATEKLQQSYEEFILAFDDSMIVLMNASAKHGNQRTTRTVETLQKQLPQPDSFRTVLRKMNNYISQAENYISPLEKVPNELTFHEQAEVNEWLYWINEMKIKAGEWVELFLDESQRNTTVWMEKDSRSLPGSLQIKKSPIYAGSVVRTFLDRLEGEAGVIWTSGTLTAGKDERFVLDQLGVSDTVPLYTFDAPENFYAGAHTFIVEDMPDIQQVTNEEYIAAVADSLIQTAVAIDGRVFALFLSHDMLKKTYEEILDSGSLQEDYMLIAQGVSSGSRHKLLKTFKQQEKAILFGTTSFWEGVDVPSDELSAVVIVRLPFTSPEEPLYKARAALLQENKKNAFTHLGLPEAILRFRQGFGRLIRSSDEKGFFIILDRRIETKSYGRNFLEALPKSFVKKVSLETLVNEIENCYNDS